MGAADDERHREDRERIGKLEAQAEIDRALITYLQDESIVDAGKIENLEAALVNARGIGTAVGILMHSRKITDRAAFELLRDTSQATNRKLWLVAENVLQTGELPRPL